jgi:hypothetical protein
MLYFHTAFLVVLDKVPFSDLLAFIRDGLIDDEDWKLIFASFGIDTHLYWTTQRSYLNFVQQRYDLVICVKANIPDLQFTVWLKTFQHYANPEFLVSR